MSSAALDRLLALLIAAQLATGLLSLRAGAPPTAALFVAHGILAGALLGAVAWKLRRSVPPAIAGRRWPRLALGLMLAMFAVAALAGGFAWVASGRLLSIGPWTLLTLHVWAALALAAALLVHLVPRRWRLLRPPASRHARRISRRTLLGAGGLALVGVCAWSAANVLEAVQGGLRRFTGSRWLPAGSIPPVTTFFGEGTPAIDPDTWRLAVIGRVASPHDLGLDDLAGLPQTDTDAVLDCTSGWVVRTTWSGVSLATLLDAAEPMAGARHVTVRSVTGWYARLPLEEARRGLLATTLAGQPLPAGNGAPCRLVAPDRRGLEWVKWIDSIEVS